MKMVFRVFVGVAVVMMFSAAAFGQANKLQDIVGARGSSGEDMMHDRGYVMIHAEPEDDKVYSYWWNRVDKKCVMVSTTDGRYAIILDSDPPDCNRADEKGLSTGAKVGIAAGAAAVVGALVLAHKAHDHDNDRHYDDANKEAEYERGYRDGLYNSAYHNYSNGREYSDGYSAGVEQRRQNTSHSSGWGGYRPHVNLSDLRGMRASSGESEMQSRGFRNVDGYKSGGSSYTIWWNGRTRQCVAISTYDGKYNWIGDTQNTNCR
ncbi:MAG: hypothetical protein AB7Q37_14225 [Pyrinomonadaceae bacterium]